METNSRTVPDPPGMVQGIGTEQLGRSRCWKGLGRQEQLNRAVLPRGQPSPFSHPDLSEEPDLSSTWADAPNKKRQKKKKKKKKQTRRKSSPRPRPWAFAGSEAWVRHSFRTHVRRPSGSCRSQGGGWAEKGCAPWGSTKLPLSCLFSLGRWEHRSPVFEESSGVTDGRTSDWVPLLGSAWPASPPLLGCR